MCVFFFFFKQKTAYEMRISDWSSDVCSSDLDRASAHQVRAARQDLQARHAAVGQRAAEPRVLRPDAMFGPHFGRRRRCRLIAVRVRIDAGRGIVRSEEHTSELQSLMRISYAVFC